MELNRRRYLATIGTTVSVLALAGCSEEGDFESGDGDGDGGGSSSDIELVSHDMVREDEGTAYESLYVQGEAENTSGGELSYAEVEVKFFSDGTLVDSSLDNINNWGSGETWAFEVMYLGSGTEAAEIDEYEIRAGTSV